MNPRDLLQLLALALGVAAVGVATWLIWPVLAAAAVAVGFIALTWDFSDTTDEELLAMVTTARQNRGVTKEQVLTAAEAIVTGAAPEVTNGPAE